VTGTPVLRLWALRRRRTRTSLPTSKKSIPRCLDVRHRRRLESLLQALERRPTTISVALPSRLPGGCPTARTRPARGTRLRDAAHATVFDKGNRLRLTLTGADKDNAATPKLDPAPELTVYRDKDRPSSLRLRSSERCAAGEGARLPLALITGLTFFIIILTIVFAIYMRSGQASTIAMKPRTAAPTIRKIGWTRVKVRRTKARRRSRFCPSLLDAALHPASSREDADGHIVSVQSRKPTTTAGPPGAWIHRRAVLDVEEIGDHDQHQECGR